MASPESTGPHANDALSRELAGVKRWLRWLTVVMLAVAALTVGLISAVLGAIVDFHYGEGILIAGVCVGAAAAGFVFGWIAHRAFARLP